MPDDDLQAIYQVNFERKFLPVDGSLEEITRLIALGSEMGIVISPLEAMTIWERISSDQSAGWLGFDEYEARCALEALLES